jgi:hypothetical protein
MLKPQVIVMKSKSLLNKTVIIMSAFAQLHAQVNKSFVSGFVKRQQ